MNYNPAARHGVPEIDGRVYNPYAKDFIRDPHPTWQRLLRGCGLMPDGSRPG